MSNTGGKATPIVISAVPIRAPGAGAERTPSSGSTASDMKTRWGEIDRACESFLSFLKNDPISVTHDWHVIFKIGTVARIESIDAAEFGGYETSNYAIPEHRVPNKKDRCDMLRENKDVWRLQKNIAGDIGKAVRQAYAQLIGDGYPFPGGEGADRDAIPLDSDVSIDVIINGADPGREILWGAIYPNRTIQTLFNLYFETTRFKAAACGGDRRRYDYLEPEAYAVISPDLKLTKIAALLGDKKESADKKDDAAVDKRDKKDVVAVDKRDKKDDAAVDKRDKKDTAAQVVEKVGLLFQCPKCQGFRVMCHAKPSQALDGPTSYEYQCLVPTCGAKF